MLLADLKIGLSLHERLQARVHQIIQTRPLLGNGERGTVNSMAEQPSVDVSELSPESLPQRAIPVRGHVRVGAVVVVRLIRVHPHRVGIPVPQHLHRGVVPVVLRHDNVHIVRERLASALVRHNLQPVGSGRPPAHIHNGYPRQIRARGHARLTSNRVQTHQETSRLVVLQEAVGKVHVPWAAPQRMGVSQAPVVAARIQFVTNHIVGPAVSPVGLNDSHINVTNFLEAHGDVVANTSDGVVTLRGDPQERVWRPVDILGDNQLRPLDARGDTNERRRIDARSALIGDKHTCALLSVVLKTVAASP